tara:strand:- start:2224 stop:2946 length:723 start_codon:yes stop_codon:yes gene_type:complete
MNKPSWNSVYFFIAFACLSTSAYSFYHFVNNRTSSLPKGLTLEPITGFNFGTIRQKTSSTLQLRLRNNYKDTLTIRDVITQCGCTKANASAKSLAPGEFCNFQIAFDSEAARGDLVISATIIYSVAGIDGFLSLPVNCNATVNPDYLVIPEKIVFNKQAHELLVKIKPNVVEQVHVESAICNRDFFTASVEGVSQNGLTVIRILYHPDRFYDGATAGTLTVSTDSKAQPIISLPIEFSSK